MFKRTYTRRAGQTLVEVVIAILIAAMTTVAVFSVVLSGTVSQKKAEKKEIAAMLLKEAMQTLQTFVSAVPDNAAYSPRIGAALPGRWPADDSGDWALRGNPGAGRRHDISSLMNRNTLEMQALRGTTPVCRWGRPCYFVYWVSDDNTAACVNPALGAGTELACKTVEFRMEYTD